MDLTDQEETLNKSTLACQERDTFCCEEPLNTMGLTLLKNYDEMCGTFEQISEVDYKNFEVVTPKSRPWMAILVLKRRPEVIRCHYPCGGTLITSKFVLTAAHCMHEDLEFVRFGEYDLIDNEDFFMTKIFGTPMDKPQDVPILKFIAHEEYIKDSLKNDIALISLRYPVRFNDNIRTICLPIFPDLQVWSQTEKYLEVHGWGIRDEKTDPYKPKKAYVRRLPSSECNITVDSQICIDAYETDSCKGDSGGSLAYLRLFNSKARFVQAGILTERRRDCRQTPVKVYTDVSEYMGWITNKIATEE